MISFCSFFSCCPDAAYLVDELLDHCKIHLAGLADDSVMRSPRDYLEFFCAGGGLGLEKTRFIYRYDFIILPVND